jgi:hypothetical protein
MATRQKAIKTRSFKMKRLKSGKYKTVRIRYSKGRQVN